MYKSIVFDLGGVMVDFDPRAYLVDRICNDEIEEQVYDLTFEQRGVEAAGCGPALPFDGNQRMLTQRQGARARV